jgi:hypothetical protein
MDAGLSPIQGNFAFNYQVDEMGLRETDTQPVN